MNAKLSAAHRDSCLFVVAPDAVEVLPDGEIRGDAKATLAQFPAWAAEIRALGLPVAFVAQDGCEAMLGSIPWHHVDALFIGGSTRWKESIAAARCIDYAQGLGKHTHVGRVNGRTRIARAQAGYVDSVDGTYLGFGPAKNLPKLLAWLDWIELKSPSLGGPA